MRKVHHLVNIHSGGIFSMGCKRFYDQKKSPGFRHCSHIGIVDCKICLKNYEKVLKRPITRESLAEEMDGYDSRS